MKFLVVNGPNLNLLGHREPGIYGNDSYEALVRRVEAAAKALGAEAEVFQSNHEGEIIDKLHGAMGVFDGVVITLQLRHSGRPPGHRHSRGGGPPIQYP